MKSVCECQCVYQPQAVVQRGAQTDNKSDGADRIRGGIVRGTLYTEWDQMEDTTVCLEDEPTCPALSPASWR